MTTTRLYWVSDSAGTLSEYKPAGAFDPLDRELSDILHVCHGRPDSLFCGCSSTRPRCYSRLLNRPPRYVLVRTRVKEHAEHCYFRQAEPIGAKPLTGDILWTCPATKSSPRDAPPTTRTWSRLKPAVHPRPKWPQATSDFGAWAAKVVGDAYYAAFRHDNRRRLPSRRVHTPALATVLNALHLSLCDPGFGGLDAYGTLQAKRTSLRLLLGFVDSDIPQLEDEHHLLTGYFWDGGPFALSLLDLTLSEQTLRLGAGNARSYGGDYVSAPYIALAVVDIKTYAAINIWLHPVASDGYSLALVESELERDYALSLLAEGTGFFKPTRPEHMEQVLTLLSYQRSPSNNEGRFRCDFVVPEGPTCRLCELFGRAGDSKRQDSLSARKIKLAAHQEPPWSMQILTRKEVPKQPQPAVLQWTTGFQVRWHPVTPALHHHVLTTPDALTPRPTRPTGVDKSAPA